ncbi:serine/threonine/dual specificity protein kinase, catalytic domain-containing protein [Artemisia annua]|uniref:non-specific serine/threonine protein kinase n=1 Tax=Artemisia annua TaxID=35608 RepID=A0A2U1LNN4_ARTAN|nr:serine/threonine/dual specificity protein kinase, catalytic domain-containing protein [Artemisia annua]
MDLSNILFIALCVTLLPFGFASINTTRLPSEEVDALREIGSKLGKVWNFEEDPCVGWLESSNKTYPDDTVNCTCDSMSCHVVSIFSGKIPEFIGSWNNLRKLWIQGSGLEGPIPSNITLLPNLTDLRISDLNGPNTLCPTFINTTSFDTLILRSCNLIGNLPESLSSTLKVFYLTGNMLSGNVPGWMLTVGETIDLSYNKFINTRDNCQIKNIKNAVSCLGNIQCPINYTSLYINCGGQGGISFEGNQYEADGDTVGPAHFVPKIRWGFSSTGNFLDDGGNGDEYTVRSASESPVNSSELYKTARAAPLSLTYYSWCMHNGSYNVSLHFAKIRFTDDGKYSSFGRRVFDIYIQGMRREKDFEISDETVGAGKVIVKTYTVNVMTTLEIRLYWAGKGTINIPRKGVYGPLISAISVNPNDWVPPNNGSSRGNEKSVSVGTVAGIVAVALNNTGNIMELVDSRLDSKYDMQEMMVVINLALLCTTISPTDRPAMSSVVSMLEGRIVPQSFVSEQSMSLTKMDREKMMKQLESTTESQIEEMSIPYTDSSMSAVDLYPVDRFSEYLQKRDGEAKKLLS